MTFPKNLVTQFGFVKPIHLNKFVDLIQIELTNDLNYIRFRGYGFACFYEDLSDVSDFARVEPKAKKYYNLMSLRRNITEDIRENIDKKGIAHNLNDILLPYVEEMGDLDYLVMLPNKLVMPANLNDFKIRIKGDKSAFCWFHEKRFFCYQFHLEQYLKEIGA